MIVLFKFPERAVPTRQYGVGAATPTLEEALYAVHGPRVNLYRQSGAKSTPPSPRYGSAMSASSARFGNRRVWSAASTGRSRPPSGNSRAGTTRGELNSNTQYNSHNNSRNLFEKQLQQHQQSIANDHKQKVNSFSAALMDELDKEYQPEDFTDAAMPSGAHYTNEHYTNHSDIQRAPLHKSDSADSADSLEGNPKHQSLSPDSLMGNSNIYPHSTSFQMHPQPIINPSIAAGIAGKPTYSSVTYNNSTMAPPTGIPANNTAVDLPIYTSASTSNPSTSAGFVLHRSVTSPSNVAVVQPSIHRPTAHQQGDTARLFTYQSGYQASITGMPQYPAYNSDLKLEEASEHITEKLENKPPNTFSATQMPRNANAISTTVYRINPGAPESMTNNTMDSAAFQQGHALPAQDGLAPHYTSQSVVTTGADHKQANIIEAQKQAGFTTLTNTDTTQGGYSYSPSAARPSNTPLATQIHQPVDSKQVFESPHALNGHQGFMQGHQSVPVNNSQTNQVKVPVTSPGIDVTYTSNPLLTGRSTQQNEHSTSLYSNANNNATSRLQYQQSRAVPVSNVNSISGNRGMLVSSMNNTTINRTGGSMNMSGNRGNLNMSGNRGSVPVSNIYSGNRSVGNMNTTNRGAVPVSNTNALAGNRSTPVSSVITIPTDQSSMYKREEIPPHHAQTNSFTNDAMCTDETDSLEGSETMEKIPEESKPVREQVRGILKKSPSSSSLSDNHRIASLRTRANSAGTVRDSLEIARHNMSNRSDTQVSINMIYIHSNILFY